MPYQIIYSSESSTPMQMDDLEDILESAREYNADAGITGALVYVDGFFLQILEGSEKAVRGLMGRISKDVRHVTVTVLKEGEIPATIFSDWKMAYVSATAEQVAKWAGLTGAASLPDILTNMHNDPTNVTQVAEGILSALASPLGATPRD